MTAPAGPTELAPPGAPVPKAGSFGIGLVAALYAIRARTLGPVAALHSAGLVLAAIATAGALGALVLPAVRNTAMERG